MPTWVSSAGDHSLGVHTFTHYVKVVFLPRHVAATGPARCQQGQGHAVHRHPRRRQARRGADGDVGEAGRRVARLGSLADRPEDLSSPQRHTFRVPPNPKAGFDGIVVRCQVLECEPPSRLAYSWSAGPIIDTQVIYRLEPDGDGTRVFFEHSGFDMSQPWGEQAFRGAEFGWAKMLERLPGVVGSLARRKGG